MLILHGSAHKATKPSGSQFFYDTAGSKDKTVKLYEGHVDLLNDLRNEAVMAGAITGVRSRRVSAFQVPCHASTGGSKTPPA